MKSFEKTTGNCLHVGEAISKAASHLEVVMHVVTNEKVPKNDPFPWRNLSGTLQGLHELRIKVPDLKAEVGRIEKNVEKLRLLIYKKPSERTKIHSQHMTVSHELSELRKKLREICS